MPDLKLFIQLDLKWIKKCPRGNTLPHFRRGEILKHQNLEENKNSTFREISDSTNVHFEMTVLKFSKLLNHVLKLLKIAKILIFHPSPF